MRKPLFLCQRASVFWQGFKTVHYAQTTINFTATGVRQAVGLGERLREADRVVNQWLDAKSEVYSRIANFAVSRRAVIRVNLVTVAMVVAAVAIETQPVAALAAAISVAWVMYRAMIGKKGGKR